MNYEKADTRESRGDQPHIKRMISEARLRHLKKRFPGVTDEIDLQVLDQKMRRAALRARR